MAKTNEDITKELIAIRNAHTNAKNKFADALCEYEEEMRVLSTSIDTLLFEAEKCEDMTMHKVSAIAKKAQELKTIIGRFNGLKCELT